MNNCCCYRLYLVAMLITMHHCFDAENKGSYWARSRNEKSWFEPSLRIVQGPLDKDPSQPTVEDCLGGCCQCRDGNTQIHCETTLNKCQELLLINEEYMDQEEGYYFLPRQASELRISGFQLLKIKEFSIPSSIKSVVIENVGKVYIEKNGLWKPNCTLSEKKQPPSELRITNCSITSMGSSSFSGGWTNISIVNSNLPHLESFAFINLACLNEFSLERNKIQKVKKESLSKSKCRSLTIRDNDIETIETHGFKADIISSVNIAYNKIIEMNTEAFALSQPKNFYLYYNAIGTSNRHAIQLSANNITIQLNSFGHLMPHVFHYLKIKPNKHHNNKYVNKMTIKDNVFLDTKGPDAFKLNETLGVDGVLLEISDLNLLKNCSCDLQQQVDELYIIAANTDDENGGHAVKEKIIEAITCRLNEEPINFKSFFNSSGCQAQDGFSRKRIGNKIIIPVTICSIFLAIAVVGLLIFWKKRNPQRSQPLNQQLIHTSLVIPEQRIYKQTELNVEEEFAVPLEVMDAYVLNEYDRRSGVDHA